MPRRDQEPATPSPERNDLALALVHEGWGHLQLQRPLAAWASWQRALRVVSGFPAAVEAIARLESANDLPATARAVHRFRAPEDASRRSRWDSSIRGRDLEDLGKAADLFGQLAADDPSDSAAWFNRGLCLAWLGRNAEAVSCLDRATLVDAPRELDRAVAAWSLADVLRQGAGAENLADDLRYAWIVDAVDIDPARLVRDLPNLREAPAPRDPVTGELQFPDTAAFEWLDRPMPAPSEALTAADLPRLLATAVIARGTLRLSSPDPHGLEQVRDSLETLIGGPSRPIRREAAPLPLSLLDAAVWTLRRPQGLDPETDGRLSREGVEHYYEDLWIHRPRQGLGEMTPLAASRLAASGDAVARARLAAVVAVREQLGSRARTAELYQGYPFDRLRRRLGLEPVDASAVDPADASCMSEVELRALDPASMTTEALADAYRSAAALGDDTNTARFAAELAGDRAPAPAGVLTPDLFAPLVREAMRAQDPSRALDWLDRARSARPGRYRMIYDVWAAEIHARTGDPDAALATYRALIADGNVDPSVILDAAHDLITNGYPGHAEPLIDHAQAEARREPDRWDLDRVKSLSGEPAAEDQSS